MKHSILYSLLLLAAAFAVVNVRCKLEDTSVIEPTTETLYLTSISVSPNTVNTDSIFVNGAQTPNDDIRLTALVYAKSNKSENQLSVSASVRAFNQNSVINSANLNDNGIFPDIVKGDSIFSGNVEYIIKRSYYGKLIVSVGGSSSIATSTSISTVINITRNNRPPVIDSVNIPDTLLVGSSVTIFDIFAYVRDEDGSLDINQVFFRSYLLPDSTNGSSPITLYDDGGKNNESGNSDKVPGDGIYTRAVQLLPTATKGTYRFIFQAIDQASAVSNSLKHDIVIK
jgi:hypothetical protein